QDELAKDEINHAINMFEKMEKYYPITIFLTYMSDLYLNQGDWDAALGYAQRSLELAEKYGLKDEISKANLQLSKLYEESGDAKASLKYFKDHISYKDSVNNISAVQQMANIRTDFEISQKQLEVDLLNQQKRNQRIVVIATIIALILIIGLAIGLFRRNKFIEKTKQLIEIEKERSDKLLLNILPEGTAKELKDNGKVNPQKFDSVTVMFTDFEAFTKYSQDLTPELLVKSVDYHFSKFDQIIEKYGLEKIKTIGDSYMCAGGLPIPTKDHAQKMLHAALEIRDFIENIKRSEVREITHFNIRIGIHTGPVVAGVVGIKKFAYDIWGDTVNIASRLESNSEPGKINISENTYHLIKDSFDCEYRGEIQAKNKGMMKMYYVNNKKQTTKTYSDSKKSEVPSNKNSQERAS
ncbi:adenylate/guanylate cyclase domain-containing protein, partial [Lutimonas sp.]|uniref:adenylate/guanylate cyclase domain-containing protein n=1 Tax=Lutimonas sp. TaxID=1872403 RepID=UPI003C782E11